MSKFHIRKRLKKILLNNRGGQVVRHNVQVALQKLTERPKWWYDIRAIKKMYLGYGKLV
ncbi:hypothetical protein HY065_02960 [Candidatus Berkelbacteria bacterium]|nr:hypothetical protein [Candidatus Berkelbacteria bacterium]